MSDDWIPFIVPRNKTLEERVARLEARLDAIVYAQYAAKSPEPDHWMGDLPVAAEPSNGR